MLTPLGTGKKDTRAWNAAASHARIRRGQEGQEVASLGEDCGRAGGLASTGEKHVAEFNAAQAPETARQMKNGDRLALRPLPPASASSSACSSLSAEAIERQTKLIFC
jgi:hypothetical protein